MNHPISPTPGAGLSSKSSDGGVAVSSGSSVGTRVANAPATLLAEIFVYVGQEQTAKYAIEHGEYLIGRDASCHIVIDADRVSRHHARLTFNSYELVIEDFGSSNGVFIEGIQVQLPTRLHPDQEIQIGSAKLFVRLNEHTARQLSDALWDADLGLAPVREQLEGKKYKPLTTIARGGMGVVLQARDLRIRRNVAMKVMKTGAQFSRESVLRFIDEAQLTGQLEHPNIVPVYELGIDDQGETFYTMKFVKGITLDEVLRGLRHGRKETIAKNPLASLITIFQKICDGVAFAHSKGVIHRDLKPENVMIGSHGEVLVMDWGLAKQTLGAQRVEGRVETVVESRPRDVLRGFQTMHGVVIGTPPYISPEQARGDLDAIDVRSDVYVLGAILYAILCLRATVHGDNIEQVLQQILAGAIKKPLQFNKPPKRKRGHGAQDDHVALVHCPGGRIPEGLAAIAMKALKVRPEDRYQSVDELQADLTQYQGGFATKAERASLFRHVLLFAGRHKREFALFLLFGVIFHTMLVVFVVNVSKEKNRALRNEQHARESEVRAKASEMELAQAIESLRGTAPVYAQEAASLLDDQKPEEALEKIEYAIEQVPNEPNYHLLRGNILQTLLRLPESNAAYAEALRRNPNLNAAKDNTAVNDRLIKAIGDDPTPSPAILRELRASLADQRRVGEALYVMDQIGRDKKMLTDTFRAALMKRGFRTFEAQDDETVHIDLSKRKNVDLRNLRALPVSGLILDDSPVVDLAALRGLPINTLSLSHTLVRDLTPLIGMPLRSLNLDASAVVILSPLTDLPLETLRLSNTRVDDLRALKGSKIEQLNLNGCRAVKDLTALDGVPLQKVDLGRTGISDLAPLIHSPIRELTLEGCTDLIDLKPLLEMTSLESVLIPTQCKKIDYLRDHPTIKRISYKRLTQPAYEFWDEFDAKKGNPKPAAPAANPAPAPTLETPAAPKPQ
jgi:serine/threonine protein kinase